jgi:pyruvate formate lyase activating enzyme
MENLKKVPVKGFIETSFVDWPGKICSVIFFPKCNFRCCYCHNSELVLKHENLEDIDFDSILVRLSGQKKWIDGICISGGEPTLYSELPEVFSIIKKEGFLTKLDTNGTNPEMLKYLVENRLVDYVAMDVKSPLDEKDYCKITQAPSMLKSVKESISFLLEKRVEYEFRFTVLPSHHKKDDIFKLAMDLNGADKLRIQNFNPSKAVLDSRLHNLKPFTETDIDFFQESVDKLISR